MFFPSLPARANQLVLHCLKTYALHVASDLCISVEPRLRVRRMSNTPLGAWRTPFAFALCTSPSNMQSFVSVSTARPRCAHYRHELPARASMPTLCRTFPGSASEGRVLIRYSDLGVFELLTFSESRCLQRHTLELREPLHCLSVLGAPVYFNRDDPAQYAFAYVDSCSRHLVLFRLDRVCRATNRFVPVRKPLFRSGGEDRGRLPRIVAACRIANTRAQFLFLADTGRVSLAHFDTLSECMTHCEGDAVCALHHPANRLCAVRVRGARRIIAVLFRRTLPALVVYKYAITLRDGAPPRVRYAGRISVDGSPQLQLRARSNHAARDSCLAFADVH